MNPKSVIHEDIIIKLTNEQIKYWTGITIDPSTKKFRKDLYEIANIILSVEYTNGTNNKNNYIKCTVNELTRKTIKNLISELLEYKHKPIMHTELKLEEPQIYHTPQYFGIDPTINQNSNPIISQSITHTPMTHTPMTHTPMTHTPITHTPMTVGSQKKNIKFHEDKTIKYQIDSSECKYIENQNTYEYIFSTELDDVKKIKLNDLQFIKCDYNITNDNNAFILNDKKIIIEPGNYNDISQIIEQININLKNTFGNEYSLYLNNITNKISINKTTNNIKRNNNDNDNKFKIEFITNLNKVLGFNSKEYTNENVVNAENMYKMPYKNDVYISIYINGHNPIIENYKVSIKDIKFLDTVNVDINKEIDISNDETIEFIIIKFRSNIIEDYVYYLNENTFIFNLEYIQTITN